MKIDPGKTIAIILGCLIVAEGLLPWCLIWLSDQFFFEVTRKLIWVVFGGPVALGTTAMIGTLLWSWLSSCHSNGTIDWR